MASDTAEIQENEESCSNLFIQVRDADIQCILRRYDRAYFDEGDRKKATENTQSVKT